MRTAASLIQALALIVAILGTVAGAIQVASPSETYVNGTFIHSDSSAGIPIIAEAIIGGLVLYAFGAALDALADIRDNTETAAHAAVRSANALEALATRQRPRPQEPVAQPLPEPQTPLQRVKQRNTT